MYEVHFIQCLSKIVRQHSFRQQMLWNVTIKKNCQSGQIHLNLVDLGDIKNLENYDQ